MLACLRITGLLICIDMPDNVIRQSVYAIACSLRHLREALCLRLVLECVCGEVDAGAVYVCFNDDVDATDAVELDLLVGVGVSVAHLSHVDAVRLVFFVTLVMLVEFP